MRQPDSNELFYSFLLKMNLITHLEAHLGQLDYGWKSDSEIQIARFKNQPFEYIYTYSTIGLSNHSLVISKEKQVRQELIFSCYQHFNSDHIASFLLSFSEHILETKRALLRGEVIGPGNYLIKGVATQGVYVSIPVFFEESFHELDTKPATVFVWLIPLLMDEILFIQTNGWEKFEDLLEKVECDFWDLNRKSILVLNKM